MSDASPAPPRRIDLPAVAIAVALAAAAAVIGWDALSLSQGSTYGVGPKAVPIVVAIGLGLLALANLASALRGQFPARESMSFTAVGLILAGMVALMAVIGFGGGFIIATALLFTFTSAAFGRRAPLVDFALGFVLAALIYLAFDKILTLSLPAGPLERLI